MALTIETVPKSIPFERVQELVRSLGLETRDLRALRIDTTAVTAEVYARNDTGDRYLVCGDDGDRQVAMHHIVIPVTRPEVVDPPA